MGEWSQHYLSVPEVRKKIEELHALRSQRRRWLAVTSLCALAVTIVCLLIIRNAAVGLLQDGPAHDEFVADLTREISKAVLPQAEESSIQASCGTLPLPPAALPIDPERSSAVSEPSYNTDPTKTEVDLCNPTDDPHKPLGHYREQMVSEYERTVKKIVDDLVTIRGRAANDSHRGFSADAIATLFIDHIQDGLSESAPADHRLPTGPDSSKDSR